MVVILFAGIQQYVTAEYKLIHYLPHDSDIRYGEELANNVIGGRALLLMSVPFAEDGGFASSANTDRLDAVEKLVNRQFGASHVFSANRVLQAVDTVKPASGSLILRPKRRKVRGRVSFQRRRQCPCKRTPAIGHAGCRSAQ